MPNLCWICSGFLYVIMEMQPVTNDVKHEIEIEIEEPAVRDEQLIHPQTVLVSNPASAEKVMRMLEEVSVNLDAVAEEFADVIHQSSEARRVLSLVQSESQSEANEVEMFELDVVEHRLKLASKKVEASFLKLHSYMVLTGHTGSLPSSDELSYLTTDTALPTMTEIPEMRHAVDVAAQTDATMDDHPTSAQEVQTDITWTSQCFHCRCCSRPPKSPHAQNSTMPPNLPTEPRGLHQFRRRSGHSGFSSSRSSSPSPASSSSEAVHAPDPTDSPRFTNRHRRRAPSPASDSSNSNVREDTKIFSPRRQRASSLPSRALSASWPSTRATSSSRESSASTTLPSIDSSSDDYFITYYGDYENVDVIESLGVDGSWVVMEQNSPPRKAVSPWLQHLTISGTTVLCGDGSTAQIFVRRGKLYLEGGLLSREGNILHRDGTSGQRVSFICQ